MTINTAYLQYALEIDRVGSISQAALNLYMAQPNLSKALHDLEKEIGFPVFKRTSSGVKTTEEGAEFLLRARKVIDQIDAIERIGERKNGEKLKYKISIPRGSYIVNGFTSFISESTPKSGMEVTIHETNELETINNVADHNYNIGIIRYQVDNENYFLSMLKTNHLAYEVLWEFEYVLVMSQNHPLANKETITIDDLKEYTKITHGDIELPHDKRSSNGTPSAQNTIYVYERGSQFDLLANVPTTYMWVSPIPQQLLDKNNLVQRSCKTDINLYKDVMIYRENYSFSEYDILFQKKLYEAKVDVATMRL